MRAEIWLGGMKNEAYRIDGVFCKITDEEGFVFETSPHNVVLCYYQKEQEK